jgi:transposase InsO family protein
MLLTLKVVESLETQVVLDQLAALFAKYGKPEQIVTDNATTFRSVWDNEVHRFSEWLAARGVAHRRIPSYYPEANGKAEAAVKIVKREAIRPFLKASEDWTIEAFQRVLDQFQEYYNFDRLHGGIEWKTPNDKLRAN